MIVILKIMALSKPSCGPCSRKELSPVVAIKYCTDCEENFCQECLNAHSFFNSFVFHHLVDSGSLPVEALSVQNSCTEHDAMTLDFFCVEHDCLCCCFCMAETHRTCQKVVPVHFASEGVHTSSMLEGLSGTVSSMRETLEKLMNDRDKNLTSLNDEEADVLSTISRIKAKRLEHLDELERMIKSELKSSKIKCEKQIKSDKEALLKMIESLEEIYSKLNIMTRHGSKNRLFILLNSYKLKVPEYDIKIQEITKLMFTSKLSLKQTPQEQPAIAFGSVQIESTPCPVDYTASMSKQAQAEFNMSKPTFQGTLTMTISQLKQKFLCCSGCSNEYDEQDIFARLMPCLHSLCNQCVQNLSKDGSVVCPECGQKHDINREPSCFPRDNTRQDLMDFVKAIMAPGEILCQACRETKQANYRCKNCSEFLCDDCQVEHKKTNLTKTHDLLELQALQKKENLDAFCNQLKCPDHQRDLELYCNKKECQKPICFMCALQTHRQETGHDIQEILKIANQKKDGMRKLINDVNSTGEEVKKVTELINRETQNVKNLEKKVESEINTFDQFLQILQKRRDELKKDVLNYVKVKTDVLETQLRNLKQQQRYIQEASEFADLCVMYNNPPAFLQIEGTVMSRLDKLNQQWFDKEPHDVTQLKEAINDPNGTTFDTKVYQNGSEEFRVTFIPFQAGRYKLEASVFGNRMGFTS